MRDAAPAPHDSLLLCLVLPVRNKAMALPSSLASIAAQRKLQDEPFDPALVEILLLANNCADETAPS